MRRYEEKKRRKRWNSLKKEQHESLFDCGGAESECDNEVLHKENASKTLKFFGKRLFTSRWLISNGADGNATMRSFTKKRQKRFENVEILRKKNNTSRCLIPKGADGNATMWSFTKKNDENAENFFGKRFSTRCSREVGRKCDDEVELGESWGTKTKSSEPAFEEFVCFGFPEMGRTDVRDDQGGSRMIFFFFFSLLNLHPFLTLF